MTIKEVSEKYGITQDTLRYYEKVGIIPPVSRTKGGKRDYREEDLGWVEQAICMRSAGVSIDALIEYLKLCQIGNETISARLNLLKKQRELLFEQKQRLEAAMDRLNYKVSVYEEAEKTGELIWDKEN